MAKEEVSERVEYTSRYVEHTNCFVILSGRPGYIRINVRNSPQYKEWLDKEKTGTLPRPVNPQIIPRAALHASEEMFMDTSIHPETYAESKVFKPEIVECEALEDGRILISRDKPELCRAVLKELRQLDPNVKLDPLGLMLPEEIPDELKKPLNKGGRGRTNLKMLGGDIR